MDTRFLGIFFQPPFFLKKIIIPPNEFLQMDINSNKNDRIILFLNFIYDFYYIKSTKYEKNPPKIFLNLSNTPFLKKKKSIISTNFPK